MYTSPSQIVISLCLSIIYTQTRVWFGSTVCKIPFCTDRNSNKSLTYPLKWAMIKLKSLFRRGQGPSGSSKQTSNANSQIRGAASTSSLNSIGLSTASSSSTATAATPKSTKATLKKIPHTGSNDLFDSTFRESHESLDLKNSSSPKLYSTSSGGESTSGFISSLANSKSHSSIVVGSSSSTVLSTSPASTPQHSKRRTRIEQLFQTSIPMTDHSPDKLVLGTTSAHQQAVTPNTAISVHKTLTTELKDSDTEIGADDGCGSCYSSSMRDLLSDELPEDCTFNGNDEIQVISQSIRESIMDKFTIFFFVLFCSNIKSSTNYRRIWNK